MDHEINPECIKRTSEAVAEGRKLAFDLELKIQEMRREREAQLAEINKAIALQTVNINALTELGKSNREDIVVLKDIADSMKRTLDLLMDERNQKIEAETEARKPIRAMWIGLLEKAIWFAAGIIVLAVVEYAKARL